MVTEDFDQDELVTIEQPGVSPLGEVGHLLPESQTPSLSTTPRGRLGRFREGFAEARVAAAQTGSARTIEENVQNFLTQRLRQATESGITLPAIPASLWNGSSNSPFFFKALGDYEERVQHVLAKQTDFTTDSIYDYLHSLFGFANYLENDINSKPFFSASHLGALAGGIFTLKNKTKYDLLMIGGDVAVGAATGGTGVMVSAGLLSFVAESERLQGVREFENFAHLPALTDKEIATRAFEFAVASIAVTEGLKWLGIGAKRAINSVFRRGDLGIEPKVNIVNDKLIEEYKISGSDADAIRSAGDAMVTGSIDEAGNIMDNYMTGGNVINPRLLPNEATESAYRTLVEDHTITQPDLLYAENMFGNFGDGFIINSRNFTNEVYDGGERYILYKQALTAFDSRSEVPGQIPRGVQDSEVVQGVASVSKAEQEQEAVRELMGVWEDAYRGDRRFSLEDNIIYYHNSDHSFNTGVSVANLSSDNASTLFLDAERMGNYAEILYNLQEERGKQSRLSRAAQFSTVNQFLMNLFDSVQWLYEASLARYEPLRIQMREFSRAFTHTTEDVNLLKLKALRGELDQIADPSLANWARTSREMLDKEWRETDLAGYNVGYLEDYVPATLRREKIINAYNNPKIRRENFITDLSVAANWRRINQALEKGGLSPLRTEAERRNFVNNYYDALLDPTEDFIYDQTSRKLTYRTDLARRFFFYKDADSQLAVLKKYGEENADVNILNYLARSVKRRSTRAVVGYKSIEANKADLKRLINRSLTGEDKVALGENRQERVYNNFIDAALDDISGKYLPNGLQDTWGFKLYRSVANVHKAAILLKSSIATLNDNVTTAARLAAINDTPFLQELFYSFNYAKRLSLRELESYLKVYEGAMGASRKASDTAWYLHGVDGSLVEKSLQLSGTTYLTQLNKVFAHAEFGHTLFLRRNVASLKNLSTGIKNAFKIVNIGEKEWSQIRAMTPYMKSDGSQYLLPINAYEQLPKATYQKMQLLFEYFSSSAVSESSAGLRRGFSANLGGGFLGGGGSVRVGDAVLSLRGSGLRGTVNLLGGMLQLMESRSAAQNVSIATTIVGTSIVFGATIKMIKDILAGKNPDFTSEEFWEGALANSDLAGVFTDLYSQYAYSDSQGDFLLAMAGPNVSAVGQVAQLFGHVLGGVGQVAQGKSGENYWWQTMQDINRYAPIGRYAWGGIALQRAVIEQLPFLFMENAASYYDKKYDYDKYYWVPGKPLPEIMNR